MTFDNSSVSSYNATLPGPSLQSLCTAAEHIVFMTALDQAIRNNSRISRKDTRVKPIDEPANEYDFIVIGGGAGGAAVAGRLAEIAQWNTLLIEAGEDESAAGQIPAFNAALMGANIDWDYYTTNESHHCLSSNGSCYWSAARSLGGNTAHNGMVYLRGNPTDYNKWAELGNDGWKWEEVLKYFKKQEDNGNIDEVGYDYHSRGGPVRVEYAPHVSKFAERVLNATAQSDFGVTKDLNGKHGIGFTVVQMTQDKGVRVSSNTAYLQPHRDNKNLDILLSAFVTKILIQNNTAVGVEYIKNGELKQVIAKKEVILSAGTIRSPQLLMVSGVGPKEHLQSHGIEVVLDLPGVGENLHDHSSYWVAFTINDTDTYDNNVQVATQYLQNQTGPMSTNGETHLVGIAYTNRTTPDYPDLQYQFFAYTADCAPGEVGALKSDGRRKVTIAVTNVHPESRGRISLASKDPSKHPVIWCNYMGEDTDRDVIIEGIDKFLNLVISGVLREYDFQLAEKPAEACSNYTIPSREYWACAIKQGTATELHQVGTCKMGPASDPMAVVDAKLRVHGIKHLRVVDASIMPTVPTANTAGPTMMIGERGADFLKDHWASGRKHTSYI